ncbi:MAG: hypothetical protein ABSB22_16730 [Thermodesulfobacteriota bacterium]|jgi:hypothetical protein
MSKNEEAVGYAGKPSHLPARIRFGKAGGTCKRFPTTFPSVLQKSA